MKKFWNVMLCILFVILEIKGWLGENFRRNYNFLIEFFKFFFEGVDKNLKIYFLRCFCIDLFVICLIIFFMWMLMLDFFSNESNWIYVVLVFLNLFKLSSLFLK